MCFSGGTVVEKDKVVAFYPGIGAGQMVATSSDPLLLNWDKSGPIMEKGGDADIWKEGDTLSKAILENRTYAVESSLPEAKPSG